MEVGKIATKPAKVGDRSPYCVFKSDHHRLWALISRDVRLVLIACLLAVAAPSAPSQLSLAWAAIVGGAHQ